MAARLAAEAGLAATLRAVVSALVRRLAAAPGLRRLLEAERLQLRRALWRVSRYSHLLRRRLVRHLPSRHADQLHRPLAASETQGPHAAADGAVDAQHGPIARRGGRFWPRGAGR